MFVLSIIMCLKEVNALEGVGKGSIDTVRVLSVCFLMHMSCMCLSQADVHEVLMH